MEYFTQISWLIFAGLSLLFVILRVRLILKKMEMSRKSQVKNRKAFEAIATESPVDNPKREARKVGLESIERRFVYLRRIIFAVIFMLGLPLIILPFVSQAPTAYISFFVGLCTLIIGIAAKPWVENVIAGIVLSTGYPLRIGDTVIIDEHYGTVEKIALTYTIIKIWDWRRYVIPNNRLLQKEFVNYSAIDKHIWAQVEFSVSPNCDIEQVEKFAIEAAKSSQYYSEYEEPSFWIMELNRDSIICWLAAWAETPSLAWELKHDIRKFLIKKFKEAEIDFQMQSLKIVQKEQSPSQ